MLSQVLLAERDSLRDTNDELQVAAQEAKNEHIVNEDGDHQSPLEVKYVFSYKYA